MIAIRIGIGLSLVSLLLGVDATELHQFRAPVIKIPAGLDAFHGTIREDQRTVDLKPELEIVKDSGPVCSYEAEPGVETPFSFEVVDQATGRLLIHVNDGGKLDCSATDVYHLRLRAVRCDSGETSDRVAVEIKVADTNDHAPEFDQPWYTVEVDEGRLYDNILRLTATDGDCGHPYGEICRYEIANALDGIPFDITDQGVLRNVKPLSAKLSGSHVLSILAHDCGMRKSKPTLVTVKVREACIAGLKDIPDRIEYYPGSSSKYIADHATLNLCDAGCEVEHVEAKIALETGHIGRGCDRDTDELRNSCGVNSRTVDLLPKQPQNLPVKGDPIKANDIVDESGNADEAYLFDGTQNAVAVAPATTKPLVPRTFTLSFWMRHQGDRHDKQTHNHKENILCSSDDHELNRHHFAVYLKNCKLELLLRHEYNAENADERGPAEWRWHLEEVCDNEWHHYTISMDLPNVDLVVDGRPVSKSEDTMEILDDWPMHKSEDLKWFFIPLVSIPVDMDMFAKNSLIYHCSRVTSFYISMERPGGKLIYYAYAIVVVELINIVIFSAVLYVNK